MFSLGIKLRSSVWIKHLSFSLCPVGLHVQERQPHLLEGEVTLNEFAVIAWKALL